MKNAVNNVIIFSRHLQELIGLDIEIVEILPRETKKGYVDTFLPSFVFNLKFWYFVILVAINRKLSLESDFVVD